MTLPPWSLHSVENTAMMGLQATTATKRKYEMGACGNAGDVQANCTPAKASRWSTTTTTTPVVVTDTAAPITTTTTTITNELSAEETTLINNNNNNNINNNEAKPVVSNDTNIPVEVTATSAADDNTSITSSATATVTTNTLNSNNAISATTVNVTATNDSTTTSSSSINNNNNDEDTSNSIAKLEAVVVHSEPWNNAVDSISRLQAVAVPDTWGSSSDISGSRSTLATTLMHSDDLDEDDEDFEDDFDEEESIIPSYSPMRYPCAPPPSNRNNYNMSASNVGYGKPNYYSEPYPQQNCSRTPTQYARQPNGHYGWNSNGYYIPPEAAHPHTQQTIRCAENGKSYLELGSSNYVVPPPMPVDPRSIHPAAPPKRCACDGRNSWCSNKQCYRDRRLKMRNLSMFKLSRFRQVSEQSLYRSVLICNTLKSIDREMEHEAKQTPPEIHHHHHYNNHPRMVGGPSNGTEHMQCPPTVNHQYSHSPSLNNDNNGYVQHQQLHQHHHQQQQQQHHHLQPQQHHHQQPYNSGQQTLSHPSNNVINRVAQEHQSPPVQQQPHSPMPIVPAILSFNESQPPYDHHPLKEPTGRATPFPNSAPDTDSGYGDDDCMRPINWGSVLSLSSQSALDPLNNNDLFTPSSTTSIISSSSASSTFSTSTPSFVTVTSTVTPATNWEYNLLDMDLGLGPELTELLPSWKLTPLSADDILKSVPPPMEPSRILMDTDMDQLTHIMVGS